MALLDALRVLTSFDPPAELPACDLDELLDVLDAHGLAPLASFQIESRGLGARVPMPMRERLLGLYQGTINDNVYRMVTLKGILRAVAVPAVVLDGAAYVDWLYPHLAFRPLGQLRLAVRGQDGQRFADGAGSVGFPPAGTGPGGHTALLSDGRIELRIQEGLVAGSGQDHGLFERCEPYAVMGPTAARPSSGDALLMSVSEIAKMGLQAPLLAYVDLRELLLRVATDEIEAVKARARQAGLERALYGALELSAHFYPQTAERAAALSPELARAERAAVDTLVDSCRDPSRLRRLRGVEEAGRLLLSPA